MNNINNENKHNISSLYINKNKNYDGQIEEKTKELKKKISLTSNIMDNINEYMSMNKQQNINNENKDNISSLYSNQNKDYNEQLKEMQKKIAESNIIMNKINNNLEKNQSMNNIYQQQYINNENKYNMNSSHSEQNKKLK